MMEMFLYGALVGVMLGFIVGHWLMRKEGQREFEHMPTHWNADRKMCACGKLWPHD